MAETVELRVLYVEDDEVDADLTRRELARVAPEIRLEVAETVGRALELLAPPYPRFDVVLTDLSLPDGSGLELISHCRERELQLALVIITGSGDQAAAVAALKAGADDYLIKRPGLAGQLPRVLRAAHADAKQKLRRRTRPLRLLYAEPNRADADLTHRHLARHARNVRMQVVGCGEEVLALLPMTREQGPSPFDVLMLDYQLPGINALDVVKELREERGLDLPIIMVTGHGSEEAVVRALRQGVDDYLAKQEGYLQTLPGILEKMEKQAELNRSEERYRTLFENSQAIMLVIDPQYGEVVDCNPAAVAWYGWPRERFRRMNASEIYCDPSGERDSLAAPGWQQWHFLGGHLRADGSQREVEVFGGPVAMGGRSLSYCIVHDVTEKTQAEEELMRSEREFRGLSQEFNGLLDAIPDSLMLLDRELHLLWANKGAVEHLESAAGQVEGMQCYRLDDQDGPCQPCPVQESFQSGLPCHVTVTTPGDGRVWDTRTVPLLDEQGRVEKVIKLRRDVTEQKKMEMQYLHAQKMESIGTLAGGVAHDFNNILTVIAGLGQLTLDRMGADDPLRANLAGIMEASVRASFLTRELLLFSRKQRSERSPVDLNEVVSRMQGFLRRVIGEDIALSQKCQGETLPIMADRNQLEQVLMNLAVNARDAMPQGGVFLLQTGQAHLQQEFFATYGYGRPGNYALLTVSDTGVGMDQETQQRIFEPFFSTKEVGKGTGLGLSVVYGIVKQHDGFIAVYSEPGHGSTFRVYLPLISEAIRGGGGGNAEQLPTGGTETILLAEDNDLVRELFDRVLSEAGYRVIATDNGEEAVREFKARAGEIDLLLFDLIMPGMNGKAASDEIRSIDPRVKTLFASGYAPEIAQQKTSLEEGAYLVHKPVAPSDLLKMVRVVLDGAL